MLGLSKRRRRMKISALVLIVSVLGTPMNGSTQSNDIQVELAKENKFVVKVMKVFNKSGNKISGINKIEFKGFLAEKVIYSNRSSYPGNAYKQT